LNESIHSFNHINEPLYDYFIVYLSMERDKLYERINKRVDLLFQDGLLDEVKALYLDGFYPHAIGYQELVSYFDGDITLESAIEEIKKNTRHLAKRQERWFRHQMDSHCYIVDVSNIDITINEIISDVDGWLK
jgi:tRNA dimethylallyltransferase